MPSPIPPRDRNVYFLGAGLSSAFGLPNTPSLITDTITFAQTNRGSWLRHEHLRTQLTRAFRFFYPDAQHAGFQPDVVDFFSSLRAYIDVGARFVGTGFQDSREFYRLLRRAITHLLIDRMRLIDEAKFAEHVFLTELVQPGHIIVTSNWDLLIEYFADLNEIPLRLTSRTRHFPTSEVTLIKLHGSIDWCQGRARSVVWPDEDYATLKELQFGPRIYRHQLPADQEELIRVRCMPVNTSWQVLRSRAREPHIVTMVMGKADDLGPLQDMWSDAYRALSRAERIEIIGYSMPPDDVEIRTILRTGIQRGRPSPEVVVRNPAPDVHHRVRAYLDPLAQSNYLPVPGC